MSQATSSAQSGIVGSAVTFNESPGVVTWVVAGVAILALVALLWFGKRGAK